jgi:hypothetical protein
MDSSPLRSAIRKLKKSKAKEDYSPLYRPRPPKRGLTVETSVLYSESPLSALTYDSSMTNPPPFKKSAPGAPGSPARTPTAVAATWTSPRNKPQNDPKRKAARGGSNPSEAGKRKKKRLPKGHRRRKLADRFRKGRMRWRMMVSNYGLAK